MSTDRATEMRHYLSAISPESGESRREVNERFAGFDDQLVKMNERLSRIERQQLKRLDPVESLSLSNHADIVDLDDGCARSKRRGRRVSG